MGFGFFNFDDFVLYMLGEKNNAMYKLVSIIVTLLYHALLLVAVLRGRLVKIF